MENRTIKAFKGFSKDMVCRDFRYEEDHEYEHNGPVAACEQGFHACEHPLDCFGYYPPASSVYHKVELSGDIDRDGGDTKVAASHIKIGARLNIAGLCKAAFEFVKSRCTNENNAIPGEPATAGYKGAATSRGKSSSGNCGLSVARGNGVRVRGGLGAILVIVEESTSGYDIEEWKAVMVDSEHIKADTWYRLSNGELTECDD